MTRAGRIVTEPATAVPLFDGATPLATHPRRVAVETVMGLPVSVHVRGPQASSAGVGHALARFFAALRADDARFSTWRPDSEVSALRRGDLRPDDASPALRTVIRLCEEAGRRTDGAFSAWLPDPDGDPAGPRRFDPTGLVKGWSVERALDLLADDLAGGPAGRARGTCVHAAHDVLVNAGGDVAVVCARTDTPDWVVAVEDPRDRSRTVAEVPLRRGAVATSGTAARGRHLVDPRTGGPACDLLSATVIGPSLTWADVYATAAFVQGLPALPWLERLPEHAGLLVDLDGRLHVTRRP